MPKELKPDHSPSAQFLTQAEQDYLEQGSSTSEEPVKATERSKSVEPRQNIHSKRGTAHGMYKEFREVTDPKSLAQKVRADFDQQDQKYFELAQASAKAQGWKEDSKDMPLIGPGRAPSPDRLYYR